MRFSMSFPVGVEVSSATASTWRLDTLGLELRGDGDKVSHGASQSVQLCHDEHVPFAAKVKGSLKLLSALMAWREYHIALEAARKAVQHPRFGRVNNERPGTLSLAGARP
jgi:hypothetical protein